MSALIASDAPLTSPVSDCSWDQQPFYSPTQMDSFPFNYHQYSDSQAPSPPYSTSSAATGSPVPAERMLKMRMTPDYSSDQDSQLCLPTHQVFEIPPAPDTPPSPVSPHPQLAHRYATLPASSALKRPPSPTPSCASASKKPRASAERISTKDFIPPDVSGLSKREARLVKNRAAAFLSRQRKREEFESMEIRVAELEQENARLQAIAQAAPTPQEEVQMLSEIEQLRTQLAAAEERERQLSSQLSRRPTAVKVESAESRLPTSPTRPMSFVSQHKSEKTSASLSLLVLLCALPSIFSMSAQSHPALPMTGSFPISNVHSHPFNPSKFDFNSYLPTEHDWRMSSTAMDLDRATSQGNAASRKLAFVDSDATALGLGGLDISFDAEPSENGKIRVRIHHPSTSTPSSPSSSFGSMSMPPSQYGSFDDPSAWNINMPSHYPSHTQPTHAHPAHPAPPQFEADPFLGVGMPMPELPYGMDPAMLMGIPTESNINTAFGKRRVRIALKSMPAAGTADGGEWEVELC
ncbi:hypothetical protein OF83DRAFT_1172213 [Amylostereum chailletii]|nr:hypothetical protein OF83DRAFT_1172213 [Amylostereum chailletii]